MRKRILMAGVGSVAALALTAGPALAHQCFVVGQTYHSQAQNSKDGIWDPASVSGFLIDEIGVEEDCALAAEAYVGEQGLPTYALFRSDKTIGSGSNNPNLDNGKGLEHASESDALDPIIGAAFQFIAANSGAGQVCAI